MGELLEDPDRQGMTSSWSTLRHICLLEEFSKFLTRLSFPQSRLVRMFLWPQSFSSAVKSTFWERRQMVEVSSYSYWHILSTWKCGELAKVWKAFSGTSIHLTVYIGRRYPVNCKCERCSINSIYQTMFNLRDPVASFTNFKQIGRWRMIRKG